MQSHREPVVDPSVLIDAGAWSRYQQNLLIVVACALLFDGLDNQALALAIPALTVEWGVGRSDFAFVLTLGLAGMAVGTAFGGMLGDRVGRKPALVASVLAFGLLTCALSGAATLGQLGILKFLGGVGLGGAVPNAMAFVSEITPARRRSLAVILAGICIGIGGLLGGIAAAWILPAFGWQALFFVVGMPPVLLALLQWAVLPESPKYLAGAGRNGAAIHAFLRRSGQAVAAETSFLVARAPESGTSLFALFHRDVRRDTLALWSAYWLTLFSVYALASWLPSIFAAAGFDLSVASIALAAFNLGGIAGSLGAAWAIHAFGSRLTLVAMTLVAAAGAAGFAALPLQAGSVPTAAILLIVVLGMAIAGLQVALYSVAVQIYDDANRAGGLGWAVGFGRIGGIVSPILASAMLAAGGSAGLFIMIAVAMIVCAVAIASIRRHLPRGAGRSN